MSFTLAELRYSPGIARYQEPDEEPRAARVIIPALDRKTRNPVWLPQELRMAIGTYRGTAKQAAIAYGVSESSVCRCRKQYANGKRHPGRLAEFRGKD